MELRRAELLVFGFSASSARLLWERGVAAVGIDSISLDSSKNQDQAAHYALLKDAAMSGLENMAQLEKLPARGATIVAAPTKIRGGTGGQTRVFAIGWQGQPSLPAILTSQLDRLSPTLWKDYSSAFAGTVTNSDLLKREKE